MPNRLSHETSPYLLQHANNPVDWHPWCEQALTLARELDKPILLSIGYSSCHWCHVMAHECFEDEEVAALMNRLFINIKVDREERPDLDHIYQMALLMMTQRGGGWPLTMFLSPAQMPFFGGTYFPKHARYQLSGLMDLLPRVSDFYHTHKVQIAEEGSKLVDAFQSTIAQTPSAKLDREPLDHAIADLCAQFDDKWGGFGRAPKFPRPSDLELCLREGVETCRTGISDMAIMTLEKMAAGGIYDQLGGGFCRYSVDAEWAIPHFEKMLYDNGPLLALYADVYAVTRNPRFKQVAEETVDWLIREMRDPAGGFYSALDADTEHEEGKFYLWSPEAVRALLTETEYAVAAPHYGLDRPANFENTHWHFIVAKPLSKVAKQLHLGGQEAEQRLASAKQKLLSARALRTRPGRDDKILTSWNALMIKGLARAGRVLGRPDWVGLGQAGLDFIRAQLWQSGKLLASSQHGQAKLNAYLDDYAFLLDAILELLQSDFRLKDLEFAQSLADSLLQDFEDKAKGGFYFTGHDHEQLIHRPQPITDAAMPSGNGIAVQALWRLGHVLGNKAYLDAAERALRLFYPSTHEQPMAHVSLILALKEYLDPPTIVVVRGPADAFEVWRKALSEQYLPHALVLFVPIEMSDLPLALTKNPALEVNAWACRGVTCFNPVNTPEALIELCKGTKDY